MVVWVLPWIVRVREDDVMTTIENGELAKPSAALVYGTFPNIDTAKIAARRLIEQRLAACVNVIPGMCAIYEWEGRVHEDGEVVVIAKTRTSAARAVVLALCDGHPYTNPAVLVIEVAGGSQAYLDWIAVQTDPVGG
jgi:periplasmic divalent cation tolerance protein